MSEPADVIDFAQARQRHLLTTGETEVCVICGVDTGVPRECPVDDPRRGGSYTEAGQLCEIHAALTGYI